MGKYKFIGKDSLGYEHGKVYDLKLNTSTPFQRWWTKLRTGKKTNDWMILITSPYFCPYSSVDTFNENWEKV